MLNIKLIAPVSQCCDKPDKVDKPTFGISAVRVGTGKRPYIEATDSRSLVVVNAEGENTGPPILIPGNLLPNKKEVLRCHRIEASDKPGLDGKRDVRVCIANKDNFKGSSEDVGLARYAEEVTSKNGKELEARFPRTTDVIPEMQMIGSDLLFLSVDPQLVMNVYEAVTEDQSAMSAIEMIVPISGDEERDLSIENLNAAVATTQAKITEFQATDGGTFKEWKTIALALRDVIESSLPGLKKGQFFYCDKSIGVIGTAGFGIIGPSCANNDGANREDAKSGVEDFDMEVLRFKKHMNKIEETSEEKTPEKPKEKNPRKTRTKKTAEENPVETAAEETKTEELTSLANVIIEDGDELLDDILS